MMGRKSALERTFQTRWRQLNGPDLESEYQFHPSRKWRFDFADPIAMVGIEIEGGIWMHGRHTRPAGYTNDCEKYNAAQLLGWRVFRFTTEMLQNDPTRHLVPVIESLQ